MRSYTPPQIIEAGSVRALTQMDGALGVDAGSGSSLLPVMPGDPVTAT